MYFTVGVNLNNGAIGQNHSLEPTERGGVTSLNRKVAIAMLPKPKHTDDGQEARCEAGPKIETDARCPACTQRRLRTRQGRMTLAHPEIDTRWVTIQLL